MEAPAPVKRASLNTRMREAIWRDYCKTDPAADTEYMAWVERTAARFELSEKQVRSVISQQSEAMLFKAQQATYTESQQVCHLLGLTLTKAMSRIDEMLNAESEEVLKVAGGILPRKKQGEVELDEDGNPTPLTFRRPDYRTQLEAVKQFLMVKGAYAPQHAVIDQTITHRLENLSDDELKARIARAEAGLKGYLEGAATGEAAAPRGGDGEDRSA